MLKMATYPGMSLGGEVRESISLDEDDLSDVEDEVFIRDGKNSYKLAEELNMKRPLMAPRRKLGKPDLSSRIKGRPPCRTFCKPCCYIFAALIFLIGLLVLFVILISIFPLPLDKLRDWVISKARPTLNTTKLLPCSNLKVTDVWATNLPILTTDSPIRILDVNEDGIDDIIFGFGTGDNYNVLPPDVFCPIFLGVSPPCEGGVIALNGSTGDIVWRFWVNDTIFALQCGADLTGDGLEDCLAVGEEGTIVALDSKNGTVIWQQNNNERDVFVANFVPDQDNDNIPDILASHTALGGKDGHLVLISGKTGRELKRVPAPNGARTFYMPQLLTINDNNTFVLMGTGSPNSPGNLTAVKLQDLFSGNLSTSVLYQDLSKGILTQSVLVDITGDGNPDIVTAMYNSTIVAIDGVTFKRLWNFTIPNSESNVVPTPGYFNDDNITDFLVIYRKYDDIINYNYSKTYIIDGKTGKPIYSKPIGGAVTTQMGGLTLAMESQGFDMFVFWTTECTHIDMFEKNKGTVQDGNSDEMMDVCREKFNSTSIMKLNALNQYDQPPGLEVYNSVNRTLLEFNNTKSAMKQIREYFQKHPKLAFRNGEVGGNFMSEEPQIKIHKYGTPSSFRHKDNGQGLVKEFSPISSEGTFQREPKFDEYEYQTNQANLLNNLPGELDPSDFNNYNMEESENPFNQNQMLFNEQLGQNSRDPRSKDSPSQTKKKNLSDPKYGVYDYKNVKMSRNRLLHDLNNVPNEILRDTYFKNRENQLRRSKFEQRDINSHIDKMKEKEELQRIIGLERKKANNSSYNLWDLESEKEMQDKENGYWRGKREANYTLFGMRKITSVGAVVQAMNATNAIDVVFVIYWQPPKINGNQEKLEDEIPDCIEEKLASDIEEKSHSYQKTTEDEQRDLYARECRSEQENLRQKLPYFSQINQMSLGQMTVYRIRVECVCDVQKPDERCAKFLPQEEQNWDMYLGKLGDGVYRTRN